jgi:uncharacterized protein YndB with AHSA1/START domain
MPTQTPIPIIAAHRFENPPERVFDAWLDPRVARKFLFATPAGEMLRAEIDPRVGGRYRFTERRAEGEADHAGEYLEITRPSRLVFSFSAGEAEADRVTVEIVPAGDGSDLTLTHEMQAKWAEFADRTRDGWVGILQGLADALGELPGAPW